MTSLDVLLVESHPGNGARVAGALERAGHHVHRCHEPGATGFPCTEITSPGSCPLDAGVDVALLVRRVAPHPTDLEQGVSCALRAGLPIIEDGPTILDPFEPYLTGRVAVSFHREGTNLRIDLAGPPAAAATRQALGVRVLDALRSSGRTFGQVDVSYSDTATEAP